MDLPIDRGAGAGDAEEKGSEWLQLFRGAPLMWGVLAFTIGILFQDKFRMPLLPILAVLALTAFLWRSASRSAWEWTALATGLLAVMALGAWRYSIYDRPLPAGHIGLVAMPAKDILLEGLVVEMPAVSADRNTTALVIQTRSISAKKKRASGLVRATLHWTNTITAYGDIIRIRGTLIAPSAPTNPGQSDFRAAMARRGVHALLSAWKPEDFSLQSRDKGSRIRMALLSARSWATGRLDALVGKPESGLLASIVFGLQTGDFSPEVLDSFRATGLMHILVASGLNVGLLAMICLWVLGAFGLSRAQSAPITVPVLILYLFLCGAEPPLLRSTLMFGLMVAGQALGRPGNALNALGAAGLILLALDPGGPWDRSFQLSFTATLGVLLMTGWLSGRLRFLPRWMAEAASCTIAAQLVLLPLLASLFGQLPLFGALANLLVTPVMGVFLSGGILLLGFGWIPFAGPAIGIALKWCLLAVLAVVETFARLPLASVVVPPFSAAGWSAYSLWLTGIILWMHSSPRRDRANPDQPYSILRLPSPEETRQEESRLLPLLKTGRMAALAGSAGLAVVVWVAALRPAPGNLLITFLDVGEGAAAVIRLPSGRAFLIDAGPPYAGGSVVAPFLKSRGIGRLAGVILTHAHADHEGGLPLVLRQIRADAVYLSGHGIRDDAGFSEVLAVIKSRNIQLRLVHSGMEFSGEPGVRFRILHPPAGFFQEGPQADREDANSLVVAVEFGNTSALLPADIRARAESALLKPIRRLAGPDRLLEVPHHGSALASSRRFLEAYAPRHAVASVGAHNRFGHPHPAIVIRYMDQGAELARTDRLGAVDAASDGTKWIVQGAKR